MAENFIAGRLHDKMPEHYEFFQFAYMIPDGEKIYSVFLPGFSFFLVPFVFLGIPVLVNPLISAFNVFMAGKIAEKLFDRSVAVVSMVFMVFSSFFIVMGGTWMAHPFCTALTFLAVYSYIFMLESKSVKYPILLGVSMGWLALARPQNTLFVGLALIIHALFFMVNLRDREKILVFIKKGCFSLLSFAPFIIFLLYYNKIYTGDPLVFKQDIFFNYSEPRNFCHRFGLGTGCPRSNWIELPLEGLTFSHAMHVSYRRLSPLIINLFLHPLTFLLMFFAFAFAKNNNDLRKLTMMFILFFTTFAGYFFFYFDGNVFGPRYLYEASFFLLIIFAYAFAMIANGAFAHEKLDKILKIAAFSLVISGFFYQTIFVFPALKKSYENGFWNIDAKLKEAVDLAGIKEGIVFVYPFTLYGSGYVQMDFTDFSSNKIIYVRDLGIKQNRRIMFEYPGKHYYRAVFDKLEHNTELPKITELFPPEDTGEIRVELESKFYPLSGTADFCNFFPERSYLDKYFEMKPPYEYLVPGQFLMFCRFVNLEQYYDFKQKVTLSGRYEIRIKGLQSKEMGNFKFLIDGNVAADLNFNADEEKMVEIPLETNLEKGLHDFRLVPKELVSKYNYFMIDYVDFILQKTE